MLHPVKVCLCSDCRLNKPELQAATLLPLDATIKEVTARRLARLQKQDEEFLAEAEAAAEKAVNKAASKQTHGAGRLHLTRSAAIM